MGIDYKAEKFGVENWVDICHETYRLAFGIRGEEHTAAGKYESDEAEKLSKRLVFIIQEFHPTDPTQSEIVKQHLAELREDYPQVTFQLPILMAWAGLADDGR
jgi:hypothetical protein